MVIILELSHPVVWLVRHVCSDKAMAVCLAFVTEIFSNFISFKNFLYKDSCGSTEYNEIEPSVSYIFEQRPVGCVV